MEHPSLALSELAEGEITPLHPPLSQSGPALGKALPEGSTLEDPVGEKHLRMTLPKTLGLSSMDKGKPRRGGRDVAETRGIFPFLPPKPCKSQAPSCQTLHVCGNKLRKDIPGAIRRQPTEKNLFLGCQRVGEGFLKAFLQPLHYSKQKKSPRILMTPLAQRC